MQELNKDDQFSQLMQQSKLHLHSGELENNIMQKILRKDLDKKEAYKNLKLSVLLLTVTVVLGFALCIFSTARDFLSKETFWLFQIILLSAFLLLVENLIKSFSPPNDLSAP